MKYLILFLFFTIGLAAQEKSVIEVSVQKNSAFDTTMYQKFRTNLIIGVFQSYRDYNNSFRQFKNADTLGISNNNYYAESNLITGIEINYDKFDLTLSLRSKPQTDSKEGSTKIFNASFNTGGNKWFLENSLRYFKGFYDSNTASYDTSFKETGKYFLQPNLTNTLIRSKFLYFTNHRRYSIRSNYACNYRQLRSGATWVLSANLNYCYLKNDSSFFPLAARPYYGDYATMNGLKVFGASVNAGAAATLVILKGFFLHGMFIVGPEQQWRTYNYYGQNSSRLSYFSLSGSLRASIGFNLKHFYILSMTSNDFAIYNSSFVGLTNRSLSGSLILGWRFFSKTPELYKKFQKTKLYKFF